MDLKGRRERSPGRGMAEAKESCREELLGVTKHLYLEASFLVEGSSHVWCRRQMPLFRDAGRKSRQRLGYL